MPAIKETKVIRMTHNFNKTITLMAALLATSFSCVATAKIPPTRTLADAVLSAEQLNRRPASDSVKVTSCFFHKSTVVSNTGYMVKSNYPPGWRCKEAFAVKSREFIEKFSYDFINYESNSVAIETFEAGVYITMTPSLDVKVVLTTLIEEVNDKNTIPLNIAKCSVSGKVTSIAPFEQFDSQCYFSLAYKPNNQ